MRPILVLRESFMNNFNDKVSFIWSVADLLRGLMLPLVVLRRFDCVPERHYGLTDEE